jgi:hypothetical protein
MKFAALLASLLALSILPARAADNATPDDTARFLAGLPPAADSPLAPMTKDSSWQQHASAFNAMFAQEDKTHLSKVRAFAKAELPMPHDAMLYMFSGPDALHALALFPDASTYVLSGLEPVGDVPQLTSLARGTIPHTLHSLETALQSLMTLSFFITKNMQTQLRPGPVYGTLPVIYVFLARSGKTVKETTFVNLDNAGNEIAPTGPGAKSAAKGVKIVFTAGEGGKPQTLYYFSTNLANDGVKTSGFLAFCEKLGTADSFVKSASYLLHSGSFSTVRSFMLDHSGAILQDDSGIPVSFLDRKKWQLQPFGRYVGPIAIFAKNYQSALADLFHKGHPMPIDFGIGYRWRTNESNLLLASRIPDQKPAQPDLRPGQPN